MRSRRWLDFLCLILLAALLGLHVWFPRLDAGPLNDTYSVEISGRNGFYQLAQRRFESVGRSLTPLSVCARRVPSDATLCLIGPTRYPRPEEWRALLNWTADGGSLLIAARWDEPAFEIGDIGLSVTGDRNDEKLKSKKSKAEHPTENKSDEKKKDEKETSHKNEAEKKKPTIFDTDRPPLPITSVLLTPEQATKIEWKSRGQVVGSGLEHVQTLVDSLGRQQAVQFWYGEGTILVVASDYIFSNDSLYSPGKLNGVLAYKLLERVESTGPMLFDESLNATGTPKVVGVLFDPELRPLTIQTLVIILLFAWAGNRRFGPLAPPLAAERHDIAEHTNALGNLYYKARAGAHAVQVYLDELRIRWRMKAAVGPAQAQLARMAQRTGTPAEEISQLFNEADEATRESRLDRRSAARLIRRLAKLRLATKKPAK
ncbi:MAG TPA: DUF4350 domain-containing protein [Planctomycetaceae bacterium]|nr:DUF4350 domain-containing protein [Planctomycetaceae bacterium]